MKITVMYIEFVNGNYIYDINITLLQRGKLSRTSFVPIAIILTTNWKITELNENLLATLKRIRESRQQGKICFARATIWKAIASGTFTVCI